MIACRQHKLRDDGECPKIAVDDAKKKTRRKTWTMEKVTYGSELDGVISWSIRSWHGPVDRLSVTEASEKEEP